MIEHIRPIRNVHPFAGQREEENEGDCILKDGFLADWHLLLNTLGLRREEPESGDLESICSCMMFSPFCEVLT